MANVLRKSLKNIRLKRIPIEQLESVNLCTFSGLLPKNWIYSRIQGAIKRQSIKELVKLK